MITYYPPDRLDSMTFRVSGTSDQTVPIPMRFYLDGVLIDEYDSPTQDWERILSVPGGESPTLEVFDKAAAVPSPAFPGHVTLNWLAVQGASNYLVEEYVSAVWTERTTIKADARTAYKWRTRLLDDNTSYQFRVTPSDSAGNTVTPLMFSFLMVRIPTTPDCDMTYSNSTHKVTISQP